MKIADLIFTERLRPGCKLQLASQAEWLQRGNWLKRRQAVTRIVINLDYEQRWWWSRNDNHLTMLIPTRENVTGRKCMFLPPSRVSSGLGGQGDQGGQGGLSAIMQYVIIHLSCKIIYDYMYGIWWESDKLWEDEIIFSVCISSRLLMMIQPRLLLAPKVNSNKGGAGKHATKYLA